MGEKKMSRTTQENLAQLQLLQQRLLALSAQKQQFQLQMMEIDNALSELKSGKSPAYVLVGGILIEKQRTLIKENLEEKKKELEIKIRSLEIQERKSRERAKELQEDLAKELK